MSNAPGTEISLEHSVPLNADAILPLLREQLEALEAESARDRLELSAGVPGNGTLSVPIALQVTYPAPHLGHFGIRITPSARYPLYPDFSGALDMVGTGLAEARLRLSGTYPLRSVFLVNSPTKRSYMALPKVALPTSSIDSRQVFWQR
jgi:hypothetical protein